MVHIVYHKEWISGEVREGVQGWGCEGKREKRVLYRWCPYCVLGTVHLAYKHFSTYKREKRVLGTESAAI